MSSSWVPVISRHNLVFPSALTLAHLALAAAASLALTAGLLRRSFLAGLAAFAFAHRIFRALARALISFRLWAADMRYLRLAGAGASSGAGDGASLSPAMDSISAWRDSIFSLMAMIWVSWLVVKFDIFVMVMI
jgi:hypothetical protein